MGAVRQSANGVGLIAPADQLTPNAQTGSRRTDRIITTLFTGFRMAEEDICFCNFRRDCLVFLFKGTSIIRSTLA